MRTRCSGRRVDLLPVRGGALRFASLRFCGARLKRMWLSELVFCLAVAGLSNSAAGSSTAVPQAPNLAFSSAAVGISATFAQQLTVSFSVTGSDTLTAKLHYGIDYAAGPVSCVANGSGQTCTVPVTFTPTLPGARKDALFLMDGATTLATVYLGGVGQSPLALVQPGVVTQLVSGAAYTQGESAVDENGTVYVLVPNNPSGSNVYSVTKAGVVSIVPISVVAPTGIAIDGAGILYISHEVYSDQLITWNTVTQTQGTLIPWPPNPAVACSLNQLLYGVTVDSLGNLFTLELNCGAEIEARPDGSFTEYSIDPAMNANPYWIAVDSADNVFFSCIDQINEVLANGNQSAVTNPGDPESSNLAADAADSLYVSPHTGGGVTELPATNYQAPQALLDPMATPSGLGLGSDGTLYVGNPGTAPGPGSGDLDKVDRSQGAIAFGQQVIGVASAAQNVGLYNGGNEQMTISSIAVAGANAGFAIQPAAVNNCAEGMQIALGESCQVAATLTPTHAGMLTGSIIFTTNSLNNPDSTAIVALSGSVSGPYATLSPNPVAFPNQAVTTTSGPIAVTLTNSGNATLTGIVISLAGTNSSDFAIATGANACGVSLAAGSTCSIYVTFTPAAATSYAATLSVADNASGSPQTAALTGTGTPAVSSVNININEAVHIADAPAVAQAIVIRVAEAVHIADMPLLNAPLDINIAEIIHTTDTPVLAPTAALNIAEVVHTTDAPMLAPTAVLNIAEIVHTTDAPVPEPTLDLNIAEIIHTTDAFADKILVTPTQTVLSSSSNPSLAGQSVTFTATVSAASGTPTGTVQFSINGTATGTAVPLNASGQATYSTGALADGSSSITAVYNGNGAFLSSDAAAFSQLVLDFGFTTGSTQSATIFPGQSASFEFTIDPKGTFSGTITFSASGLPPGATASFNPASLAPGCAANGVIMTVQTAQSSAAAQPASPWSNKSPLLLCLLLPLFAFRRLRRPRNWHAFLLTVAVSLGVVFAIAGCGGSGFFNEPPKTYPIAVTATSGLLQHTVTVNLTVE
jgi:Bacterial Ig-like domain (group 3)